ncbi:AtpZ/AtpI family protein [Fusobacterium mortiferum]|jgi:F0F1-type ATP synthase assembly protein I|uniref:AtpZ/AtpI family protein n=2 Tax=Fusobacterium TaxID=848 RepID=A0ABS2G0Q3_FUSMR|nr:AtpZ/AtpI family protein [Fusobacterium sp.]MBM6690992.1 AtpZ/AtpI family protein [Fusobacterium mortiferum]MBU3841679.1 AtpZ/AtpI family protein [Candidatus Fusobacterium pullicola]MBM6821351.1 AtpZ/AtpI family protein [Fusobacterium mortiferum]MBM6874590.1 AtpZ/AtpI family protein [Fusobacterium mortiferum]MDO5788249.1 AtpZ/AtpI family protein [Fusobacterium sp.]
MKYIAWITKDVLHAISLLGYLGFLMVGNILLYVGIYKLIEKYLFKSTLLFIVLIIIGVISGFYNSYRAIMKK